MYLFSAFISVFVCQWWDFNQLLIQNVICAPLHHISFWIKKFLIVIWSWYLDSNKHFVWSWKYIYYNPFDQFSTIKNLENNTFIFYYVWVSSQKTVNKLCVHKILYLNQNIWKCVTYTCLKLFFKFFSEIILIKWQKSKSLQNWISFDFCKTCNFLILNTTKLNGL